MDAREVLEEYNGVFIDRDCLFVSTTGKLLTGYVNCEVIYPHFEVVYDLVVQLISPYMGDVEGFVCPQTGDIVLLEYATFIANLSGVPTKAVWADKHSDGNSYHIERNGYEESIRGKRVVILNDRISQGGTTKKVIAEARRLDCEVWAVATIAGVSSATAEMLDVPELNALSTIDVQSFSPDQIPEEFQGLPICVDKALGHGLDFKKENPDYKGGFITLLS